MMNKNTRRLSKMPDEVRAEIGQYFNGRSAITDEQSEKLAKPGSTVDGDAAKQFIRKGLTVSWITMLYCFPGIVSKLSCLFLMCKISHATPLYGTA